VIASMDPAQPPSVVRRISVRFGLSGRLLLLTITFVMLSEILIYVPSVANFRRNWLNDRLAAAQIAALVLDAAPEERLSEDLEARLLEGVGAQAVAVRAVADVVCLRPRTCPRPCTRRSICATGHGSS
jgi:hypothetical protein